MSRTSAEKIVMAAAFTTALLLLLNSVARALPTPCVEVDPTFAMQGRTLDVTIRGVDTHFDATSQVSFSCRGITVNSVTANSASELTANITIACDASQNRCDVSVTTGSETTTCTKAFEIVIMPCDFLTPTVEPWTVGAGETLDVTISITDHDVRTIKDLDVQFSCAGITVNSVTANSSSTVIANITIAPVAALCSGYVNVTGTIGTCACEIFCIGEFSILGESPCWMVAVSPAKLRAGFILPRLYLISISASGAGFTSESTVEIEGVRFLKVINTSAAGDVINAWVIIPPRFIIGKGWRQVIITNGDEVCTGVLEIE
jgi:hypothetical protein